ncbi:MAG TPA: cupin domain-containing protein [Pyrinomonadaceae bacterium]|jgi:quercetin dioxygenase-like cupin family protein|nr:cupin domain-containing protein [Pyrinomonadaceae bacterium]
MLEIQSEDLYKAIAEYEALGYRLDMITPADSPREVQLSKNEKIVRLVLSRESVQVLPSGAQNGWVNGRAGMMYRDLLPGRMGGMIVVSHIRLIEGGEVPDYVHYHKVEFQMIRCIKGRIRVVYEDQGEPFWLEPGDWVIQPPEIRHRVLECEAGSEVIEISMPAEHETWLDHEMMLPTSEHRPDRNFGGQRFVRHVADK